MTGSTRTRLRQTAVNQTDPPTRGLRRSPTQQAARYAKALADSEGDGELKAAGTAHALAARRFLVRGDGSLATSESQADKLRERPRVMIDPAETFENLERPDLSSDYAHLNSEGQKAFSAGLSATIKSILDNKAVTRN